MIETTVRDYLAEQLPVPVFLERPETPPECYVLLEKLSAKEREGIGKASFAMQSVSGSLYAAAQLSGMVRAAMAQAVVLPEISRPPWPTNTILQTQPPEHTAIRRCSS